jgi:sodium/proline symporter
MDILIVTAFIIYFCALTLIGLMVSWHNKATSSEFMLGNRSINYWVTAVATQATDMGAYLFLAVPAAVYASGINKTWMPIGLVIGMYLNWQYIAPRLRMATEKYHSLTLSSFFEHRFNDNSGMIRLVSALMTILFFTFYIASGLVGLGLLFKAGFDLEYQQGIILALTCAVLYTLIGGFIAVAWCDFFQGMFLLAMIVLVPVTAYIKLGSWSVISNAFYAKGLSFSLASSWSDVFNGALLALGWGLGYFGQPHILVNFMAIDDVNKIKYAKRIGISWQIIVLLAAVFIGIIGVAYYPSIDNKELIFIFMAKELFPPLITGFALCGILAATLSTMDSHILISGSVLAEDIYGQWFKRDASSKELIFVSRCAALVVSGIALSIAWSESKTVMDLVIYAWSGLGSSFGPLVIASLYGSGINRYGALSGILAGGLTAAIWPSTGLWLWNLPLIPGFIAGSLALYVVSACTHHSAQS